jgi:hypothetical protein
MSEFDYITLAEAEEISGIKADTLKKRCQEGKIKGAIKEAKTWKIPRSEIIKAPNIFSKDSFLQTLVAVINTHIISFNISLICNGVIISGIVIPPRVYFEKIKESLTYDTLKGNKNDDLDILISPILNIFINSLPEEPKSVEDQKEVIKNFNFDISFIHLKDVTICQSGQKLKLGDIPIRIALKDVSAFYPGESTLA